MDGKTNEWRNRAQEIITDIAKNNAMVVSDMVVTALEAEGMGLANYSVLGGVFNRAAKEGIIAKTDITQHSTRAKSKSAKTIWRSLVYTAPDQTREQAALANCIMAALDFNAETVRLASIVYAGGQLDPDTYKRVLIDFNSISDNYQARISKIMQHFGEL